MKRSKDVSFLSKNLRIRVHSLIPDLDWRWKTDFTRSVYTNVVEALLVAKAPTYDVVLDLDKQIRQSALPAIKLYLTPEEDGYNDPGKCMRSYLMSQYRSVSKWHKC